MADVDNAVRQDVSEAASAQEVQEGEGSTILTQAVEPEEPAEGKPEVSEADEAPKEPVVPEAYELRMPEGWGLDEEGLAALTPVMRELKATNEQVQAVADIYVKRLSAAREKQLEADRAAARAWQEEIKADPDIGGGALKENLAAVSRVLARYADKEVVEWLEVSGLGNYPPFVRAMVKMARDLSDDSFVSGGRGGGAGVDPMKEAAELIYGKI